MTIRWNHKFNLQTYEPKKRVEINKEEILPHAFRFGAFFSRIGGIFIITFFFFVSLFKAFFIGKEKLRDFQRKRERVLVFKTK
jgi:hypothetical protein